METSTYIFLQHYWWFLVSLLGGLLVFLLFVQGGQSLLFQIGKTENQQKMLLNSTGRKWEFTFTTLVTFGGAFFASFPLFYSTSFGGAYWVWMLILLCFVLQAVSYEYQAKKGNLLGKKTYQVFLLINGIVAPLLIGTAVGTPGEQGTSDRPFHADYLYVDESIARIGSRAQYLESLLRPCFGVSLACVGIALLYQ